MTFPPRFAQRMMKRSRGSACEAESGGRSRAPASLSRLISSRRAMAARRSRNGSEQDTARRQLLLERRRIRRRARAPRGDAGAESARPVLRAAGRSSTCVRRRVERARSCGHGFMRGTIHMVTARDCLALRPMMDSVMRKQHEGSPFGRDVAGIDEGELRRRSRGCLPADRSRGPRSAGASPSAGRRCRLNRSGLR